MSFLNLNLFTIKKASEIKESTYYKIVDYNGNTSEKSCVSKTDTGIYFGNPNGDGFRDWIKVDNGNLVISTKYGEPNEANIVSVYNTSNKHIVNGGKKYAGSKKLRKTK